MARTPMVTDLLLLLFTMLCVSEEKQEEPTLYEPVLFLFEQSTFMHMATQPADPVLSRLQ
jgi:hypothetical protein